MKFARDWEKNNGLAEFYALLTKNRIQQGREIIEDVDWDGALSLVDEILDMLGAAKQIVKF